jgi:dihydroorotase (multifunctional complex type)
MTDHTDGLTVLRGGKVVTPEGILQADILIDGQQIVAVGERLADSAPQASVQDISGLTVLPGLIDAHVHLREPGGEHKEDFYSGTCAALAGGVTTVLAMPNTTPPITDEATFDLASTRAAAGAVCDYGLYIGGTPDNALEAARLSNRAVALKLYVGSSTGSLLVDRFPAQISHFEQYPRDQVIAVHAEDEAAVQYYATHGQRRPSICAGLATAYVLSLAELTHHRVHICHVSTGYELSLIRDARRRGLSVTCEVAPHHLFLTAADEGHLGSLGRVNPPLRSADEVAALWAQLDVVDMIATDHAPHLLEEKASPSPPSGMPGLETMLPLLLTAVREGRISLPDIARLTAARPAEVFGLARKGHVAPGYDADLTLVDLDVEWTVSNDGLYTRCGWTPFAGWNVRGRVVRVYLRGELVFDQGRILAEPGSGHPVTRRGYDSINPST